MSTQALWWLSRGTGVVTLVLLTAVVLLGVLTRGGVTWRRIPAFVVSGLHRNASLLAVTFLLAHVATVVADPYVTIRVVDAVIPFTSSYRPVWLGLGALSLDLLAAVVVTSLLRLRLGHRRWRAVHWLAYAAWPVAVVHAMGTGSDIRQPWMLALLVGCVGSVVAAVLWRVRLGLADPTPVAAPRSRFSPGLRSRAVAAMAAVASPVALAAWATSGPLAANWALRSGTPLSGTSLAAHAAGTTATPAAPATGHPTGSAQLAGAAQQRRQGDDGFALILDGRLQGAPGGTLRIVLRGAPIDDGRAGVRLTSGVVTWASPSAGTYAGQVTGLTGGLISAAVQGPSGVVHLLADVNVDPSTSALSGTVTLT